jgi:hypothetical protein
VAEDPEKITIRASLASAIPQADLFLRDQPAALKGPPESWDLAQSVVDYGCALFQASNTTRDDHVVRDLVLSALLRRATVTVEGIVLLLGAGLEEPAIATSRTLLDIELAIKLIARDPSDRLAKRLAASHYVLMQQHGEDMLSDAPTRTGTLDRGGRVTEVREVARSYKRLLAQGTLADVEEEVRRCSYWHGHPTVEAAFRAIGQSSDYNMSYDIGTWFVHAANIEHDLVDRSDSGITVRSFVERDPRRIQTQLGHALLRYLSILGVFIEEKGLPSTAEFGTPSKLTYEDGTVHEIDSYTALCWLVSKTFNPQNAVSNEIDVDDSGANS